MRNCLSAAACAALFIALPAAADDKPPMPKVYQGMGTQKGQWKVDFLERSGGRGSDKMPPSMTLCIDSLAEQARKNAATGSKAQSECKYRMLKDTASESIVESTCKDRTMTVKTTREDDKTLVMQMDGTGASGPSHLKLRYSHLGACREGQGTLSFDKNSEQCRKLRERAAKLDPERQKQVAAMCN
jgi:hypothetical protein